jgi:hypothetical protein
MLALKQGDKRLWLSTYWQAKRGTGVNRVGRFHYSTPTYDQYGTLETTVEFTPSGETFTRPMGDIDMPERNKHVPPKAPLQAYGGEELPLAKWPADARNRDPFIGRTDFSSVRFGPWWIGINSSESRTFSFPARPGGLDVKDLVSGQTTSGELKIGPFTTVVLDFPGE